MRFRFGPRRTASNLTERYNDEELMAALGVPLTSRRFCSPFRDDKHPTCNLWRSPNGRLLYRDWGLHDRPLDVFKLAMEIFRCDFPAAVAKLWEIMEGQLPVYASLSIPYREVTVSEPVDLSVQPRDWRSNDLLWWKGFGITKGTLDHYRVTPIQRVWKNSKLYYQYIEKIVHPAYHYAIGSSDKVYFPFNDKVRFLHEDGKAMQGLEQLPDRGEILVITKAMKDVMVLKELKYPAIAPQSENTPISDILFKDLTNRFDGIFILFDNDKAGIRSATKLSETFNIPFVYVSASKDISDYVKLAGIKEAQSFMDAVVKRLFK